MKFPKIQEDEIFKLKAEFESDPRKEKINGGIGVYLDDKGKPYILPTVKKAIKRLEFSNFNYLPLSGDTVFLEQTAKLALGSNLFKENDQFIAKQGTIGGTNGIYVWARFIKEIDKRPKIIIGNPTWENHLKILSYSGFKILQHLHLSAKKQFNFPALKKLLFRNPKTFILFQGGPTHNPTGINPDNMQWQELAEIIKEQKQQVLFDYAYMGLGDGTDSDSFCISHFLKKNIPISFVISYSKNMTLYQHRTGALFITASSRRYKELTEKFLQNTFRLVNSNPAAFGENIVKTIFESKKLASQWKYDLSQMRNNINLRKKKFTQFTQGKFDYLNRCRGLFALLFLRPEQIEHLKKKYAIYLLSNSRINFAGLSLASIPKVAKAVLDVRQNFSRNS